MGKTVRFDDDDYTNKHQKYIKKHENEKHNIFEEKISKKGIKKGKKILKKIRSKIWPFVDEKNKGHHKV